MPGVRAWRRRPGGGWGEPSAQGVPTWRRRQAISQPACRRDRDRGSAVVEFTLVSALLVGLFLAVVQVGLVIHVRNTLVASAAKGARYAANADRRVADGVARTEALIREALSESLTGTVTGGRIVRDGVPLVEVRVTTSVPVFGLLGFDKSLTVSGHAIDEAAL